MKTLRNLLLVLICLSMVALCACPAPTPPVPGSSSTTTGSNSGSGSGGGTVDPNLPTGAVYRPSDEGERAAYWKKLSAPAGNYAANAYTSAASGLTDESAALAPDTDLAHGFTVPYDGNYEVSADMLALASDSGSAKLTVYKNGSKIWPVSEEAYAATTQNGADRFTATTSAKKGDVIYIRASGNTTLNLSPRVTLVSGGYDESRDIEKNFPTVGILTEVGSTIENGDFVTVPLEEPTSGTTMSTDKIGNRLARDQMETDEVIFVLNDADVTIDLTGRTGVFDGKGATVVTHGKVTFVGVSAEIKNLNIIADGGIYFKECVGGTLRSCKLNGSVTVEASSSCFDFLSCRIAAAGTALENHSEALNFVDGYIEGTNVAVVDTAEGGSGLYYNAIIKGYHTAVLLGASDTTVRGCTVYGDILTETGLENLLVAESVMKNLGAIVYDGTHNSVILFNEVENVAVKNATNAYVAENAIYGGLLFDNVRYMIAEDNVLGTAVPTLISTKDYNGDNVTDITAREDVGVNEDLLPHINMDNFVNMERKRTVREPDREIETDIRAYIRDRIYGGENRLIVAPGAYLTESALWLTDVKNVDVYGYGVLFEIAGCKTAGFQITTCDNLGFYGLTVGYAESTSDQLVVLKKLPNNQILCVNAAGTQVSWGGNTWIPEAHRWDEPFPYMPDFAAKDATYNEATGFWTLTCDNAGRYEALEVGDVISCRNGTSIFKMTKTRNVYYEDFSVVGGSIRCFWDHQAYEGSIMHRVVDVPAAAKILTDAEYDFYKQLEKVYALPENYLVYIDEFNNKRGMAARTASADFAHTSDSETGFKVTSCIVSGLSDDGSNHQGWFDRVWKYDEDTGTITYRYDNRDTLTDPDLKSSKEQKLRPFKKGDRVCIFTSTGRLLVDTPALEDSVNNKTTGIATVKIDKTLLSEADLAEYDMDNYDWYSVRVLIDNMSRNGEGASFDNTLIENIRSRGLMLKCENAVVQNCTLRNIGMSAIAILYEIDWRESGFASNVVIKNNYIENTGYADNKSFYSPISLFAPAVQGTDDYLSFRNFTIEGNVVRNRGTSQAFYACGVENLTIKDNDFGDHILWDPDCDPDAYPFDMDTTAVLITYSKDVELSGNTYTHYNENTAQAQVMLVGARDVHGADMDVTGDDRVTSIDKVTSYANYTPTKTDGGLNFTGGWDLGTVSGSLKFTPFNRLEGGECWFNYSGTTWSIGSVASYYREYRYVAASSSTGVGIRYTMDADATIAVSLARFYPNNNPTASSLQANSNALYAIFVGDEMVWPTPGGSFASDGDWRMITQHTSHTEIERELSSLRHDLAKGETITFVARLPQGAKSDATFTAVPNIYYLK